ncbi:MAG: hypothetical protein LV481_04810 [Methylacidiphilales bacterium]|nr:hypothetical protein [Candidatus Methylacidiphilales bacterium]
MKVLHWRFLASGCLAVIVYGFGVRTASAQTALDAIFVQQSSGDIDNIVTTTGVSTLLWSPPTGKDYYWNGASYDRQNGLLYIDDLPTNGYSANTPITNTIYSFNPANPSGGVTEVGTITGQSAFTGAGFYNGLYYTIGSGSNLLLAYNLSAAGGPQLVSSQTLGGLGTGITGLSLGDLDFVGSTLWISAGTVTSTNSGATISTEYTLYEYTTVTNTTTPALAVSEGTEVGVGIAYDFNSGNLIMFNSDGTIATVNPNTGAETDSITITGPAASGGAGDFAIVPEPNTYAFWSMFFILTLVFLHRTLRPRFTATDHSSPFEDGKIARTGG